MYTYNPKNVNVIIGDKRATGFAEDSFISLTPKGEGTTSQTGCDGEVVRSIDINKQFVVKLVLQQTSLTNIKLREYFYKDKQDGTGTFNLSITEPSNDGEKINFTTGEKGAWVQNMAEYSRGKNAGNVEWTLETVGVEL